MAFSLRASDSLPPYVLQLVGLLGLIWMGAFWALTGRLSPTLLASAGGLVGLGHYVEALAGLARRPVASEGGADARGD